MPALCEHRTPASPAHPTSWGMQEHWGSAGGSGQHPQLGASHSFPLRSGGRYHHGTEACSPVRGFSGLVKVLWSWLGIFHQDGFQHILAHSKINGFPWENFCFMGLERETRTKCCTSALLRQQTAFLLRRDAPSASQGGVLAGGGRVGSTDVPHPDPERVRRPLGPWSRKASS